MRFFALLWVACASNAEAPSSLVEQKSKVTFNPTHQMDMVSGVLDRGNAWRAAGGEEATAYPEAFVEVASESGSEAGSKFNPTKMMDKVPSNTGSHSDTRIAYQAAGAVNSDINVALNSYASNRRGEADLQWRAVRNTQIRDLDKAMSQNKMLSERLSSEIDSYNNEAEGDFSINKNGPKNEYRRGEQLFKMQKSDLKQNEKNWANSLKSTVKSFDKRTKLIGKTATKFFKGYDKRLKNDKKKHKKIEKVFVKKTVKADKKKQKRTVKEMKKGDKELETYDEQAKEQAGEFLTLNEEASSHAEDADNLVDMMMEGQGGQGLGQALEGAEVVEEGFYNKLEMGLESKVSTQQINDGIQLEKVASVIKDSYSELEEGGSEIDEEVAQMGSQGGALLGRLDYTAESEEKDIQDKFKSQKQFVKKVEKTARAIEDEVYSGKADDEEAIEDMGTESKKATDEFKSGVAGQLSKSVTQQEDKVTAEEEKVLEYVDRAVMTEAANGNMDVGRIQSAEDQELEGALNSVENVQKVADETSLSTKEDELATKRVEQLEKKLPKEVEEMHGVQDRALQKAQIYESDATSYGTTSSNRLKTTGIDLQKLLATQSDTAMADIGKSVSNFDTESNTGLTAITKTISNVVDTQDGFSRMLQGRIRPISANAQGAALLMTKTDEDLQKVKADILKAQQTSDNKLSEDEMKIQTQKESMMQKSKLSNEKIEKWTNKAEAGMSKEVGYGVARYGAEGDAESNGANDLLNAASASDAQRNKFISQQEAALGSTFNGDEAQIDSAQAFPQADEMRIAQFNDVSKNVSSSEKAWSQSRTGIADALRREQDAGVSSFTTEEGERIQEVSGVMAKLTAQNQQSLADERGRSEQFFEGSRTNNEQEIQVSEGQLAGLEKSLTSFKKSFFGDSLPDDEVKRVMQAIGKQVDESTQRASIENRINKNFATAQNVVQQDMNDISLARNEAIRQGSASMVNGVEVTKDAENKELYALEGAFGDSSAIIQQQSRVANGNSVRVRGEINGNSATIRNDVQSQSATIRHRQGGVEDAERASMSEIGRQALADSMMRSRSGGEASAVGRDIEAEARNVDSMSHEMKQAIGAILPGIDPSAQIHLTFEKMEEIKKLMAYAQRIAESKEGDVDKQLQGVKDRIQDLISEGNSKFTRLNRDIRSLQIGVSEKLSEVKSALNTQDDEVGSGTKELTNLLDDLDLAIGGKITELANKFKVIGDDVDTAESMGKYQGAEALQKVIEVIVGARKGTEMLTHQKDTVIVPSVNAWRKNVEGVFESLGMALDLDRVARMAAQSEAADNGGILSARDRMALDARRASKDLSAQIAAIRARAQEMIHAVMAMDHLSEAEKRTRIAALRAAAEKAAMQLVSKQRMLLAQQQSVIRNIDDDLNQMNNLLAKASLLAQSHDGSAEANKMLLELQQELRKNFATLRAWAITGQSSGASLIQTASVETLNEELHDALAHALGVRLNNSVMATARDEQLDGQLDAKLNAELGQEGTAKDHEAEATAIRALTLRLASGDAEMLAEDTKWDKALEAVPGLLH